MRDDSRREKLEQRGWLAKEMVLRRLTFTGTLHFSQKKRNRNWVIRHRIEENKFCLRPGGRGQVRRRGGRRRT